MENKPGEEEKKNDLLASGTVFTPAVYPTGGNNESLTIKGEEQKESSTTESQQRPLKYPKSVFFIVANEFCERFSFYGMRTILSLYLSDKLKMGDDTATVIYHTFSMFTYFFPVFGAIIADSWLGKFKTIFYLSLVYALGNITISGSAFPGLDLSASRGIAITGLLLIAMGTGGIKPCVSAFGGDQFVLPQQERQLVHFFSIFYFAINAGSLISTFITPIFRQDIHCFGEDDCYPLAFGVPGILMVTSLIIFLCGRWMYVVKEPQGNMVVLVSKCIGHAISRRHKLKKTQSRDHWLDYADDQYDTKFIEGVKIVLRIIVLYLPLPVFWALFDQQGSRWTFQATHMNGEIAAGFTLKPDQMQVVNPLFILLLVPLFDTVIYPVLGKCNLLTKPLTRIIWGGLLAALAFVISGSVELALEKTYVYMPSEGFGELRIYNGYNCPMMFQFNNTEFSKIEPLDYYIREHIVVNPEKIELPYTITSDCSESKTISGNLEIFSKKQTSYYYKTESKGKSAMFKFFDNTVKSENGNAKVRVLINSYEHHKVKIEKRGEKEPKFDGDSLDIKKQGNALPDKYNLTVDGKLIDTLELKLGAAYVVMLNPNGDGYDEKIITVTEPNSVSMLWLLPQYIVMTMGEVMFSVTGLEFSYSQAPVTMKSVLQACWLLTTAVGNLIVVIVAEARMSDSQAVEFFFFAALMTVTMIIFYFLARSYKYVKVDSQKEEIITEKSDKELPMTGFDNVTFKGDYLE